MIKIWFFNNKDHLNYGYFVYFKISRMKPFMDEDFLLQSKVAYQLYHEYIVFLYSLLLIELSGYISNT